MDKTTHDDRREKNRLRFHSTFGIPLPRDKKDRYRLDRVLGKRKGRKHGA